MAITTPETPETEQAQPEDSDSPLHMEKWGDDLGIGLHRKIAAITGEIHVSMTGKFSIEKEGRVVHTAPAISISDVEEALAPLLSKYRVVTHVTNDAPPARAEGGRIWTVELTIDIIDADNPEDHFTTKWWEIGSTPSGAVSFALKRYYKALFHITDAEDQSTTVEELTEDQAKAERAPRRRDEGAAPSVPGMPKGFNPAHYAELKTMAENLPTDGDNPFVTNPQWAERKLVARLGHFAKDGDMEAAYALMKAELQGYLPATS